MGKRQQKDQERQLLDAVNARGNDNKCGECGAGYPTWALVNLGVFLCGRCALVHKRVLGPQVSHVKLLTLDTWSPDEIDRLRRTGNRKNKKKYNSQRVPFPFDADDDPALVDQWMVEKYKYRSYSDSAGDVDSFDDGRPSTRLRLNSYLDDARANRLRLNSYMGSALGSQRSRSNFSGGNTPRLTHRKLTTYENTQYASQVRTIQLFGYSNRDAVLEALLLSLGNIDDAVEILEQDKRVNPNQEEIAPSLPRRRPTISGAATGTGAHATGATGATTGSIPEPKPLGEWWNSATAAPTPPVVATPTGLPAAVLGAPQIYQYTDPVTGQVLYVDSNGQQYLDPLNPLHQQQLMQQLPQFLQQQATKQLILSMYGQPGGAGATGAPAPSPAAMTGQPLLNQLQQQQQQQQLQQQQLQQQQFQQQQPLQQQPMATAQQPLMMQPTMAGFGPQATGFQQQQQQQPFYYGR